MTEAELYKELGVLTKEKDRWAESIPYEYDAGRIGNAVFEWSFGLNNH